MLERLLDDVRHGSRILTKAPGLSATAALLIALVVGGNATVYSMVNGVVRGSAPGVKSARCSSASPLPCAPGGWIHCRP